MWLYVRPSPSAPGSECSTTESSSLSDSQVGRLSRSCTWKKKHSGPRIWSGRWSKVSWLRRLSGVMLPFSVIRDSLREPGSKLRDESLVSIFSSGVSPASLIRKRVNDSEPTTPATFGPQHAERLRSLNPAACSSKTSRESAAQTSLMGAEHEWSETWKTWVTESRSDSLARRNAARATGGSGGSWPQQWQTPPSVEGFARRRQVGQVERAEDMLPAQAQNWPTPRSSSGGARRARGVEDTTTAAAITFPATPHPETTGPHGSLLRELDRIFYPPTEHRRLNANFSEWLLGWPIYLTAMRTEPTDFQRWATALTLLLRRLLSCR